MEKTGLIRLHCVLVHGTFADDAKWVDSDSPLAKSLLLIEPGSVRLSNFRWTGRNTHTARVQAAKDLSDELTAHIALAPDCQILLVGHSHGGNIILRAASVIPEQLRAGVVCLASPFFHVKVRSTTSISWMLVGALISIVATLFKVLGEGFISIMSSIQSTWIGRVFDWFPSFPEGIHSFGRLSSSISGSIGAVFIVAIFALTVILLNTDKKYSGQSHARFHWENIRPTEIRTLCMWLTPDEAFWGLKATRILAEWAHYLIDITTKFGLPIVSTLAVGYAFWFGWNSGKIGSSYFAEMRAFSSALSAFQFGGLAMLIIPMTLIAAASLFSILRMLPTGTYRFSDFAWLDIQTQRTPEVNAHLIKSLALPLSDGSLIDNIKAAIPFFSGPIFHSRLYSDERAFLAIQNWYQGNKESK